MKLAGAVMVVLMAWASPAAAQLAAGDIAFVAYNSDDPDELAFVALRDLPAATVIHFTDNGWLAAGGFRAGEGTLDWSSATAVPAGTQVAIDAGALTATVGTVVGGGGTFALSASGDQCIAYTGAAATPVLLTAIQMEGAGWDADATSTNTSALPTGLVLGDTALALTPEVDNAIYGCAVSSGSPAALRAAIYTAASWTTSDTTLGASIPVACAFTTSCGDGTCGGGETVASCAADCARLDDFEDGTVRAWQVGASGALPVNVADGGPTGGGDAYLRVTGLGGGGPNSKLAVFNGAQWTGDYTARGQTTIYLHARNLGAIALTVRLVLENGASARAVSGGVALPPGGGWQLMAFDVTAGALTGGDPAAVLAGVTKLWIVHNDAASFPPPPIAAVLGVDNVSNRPLAAMCGDGVVNGGDLCDGGDLGGASCTSFGYASAAGLACNASCDAYVTTGCAAVCGNAVAEPGEACDTGGASASCDANCTAVSCGDGTCNGAAGETAVSCGADCPTTCGDALITGGEVCDGANLAGQDCAGFGYVEAAGLACAGTCASFVTTGCAAACGNTVVEPGEACDTGGVDGATCDGDCTAVVCGDARCNAAAGETAGSCAADCATVCGDGLITGSEACDGSNLAGQDCADFGYVAIAGLSCAGTCASFVTTGCTAACGNSVAEPGEACDAGGVDGAACDGDCTAVVCGDARCNAPAGETAASCAADCPTVCGDALVTGAEVCDGSNLAGQDCADFGYVAIAGLACAGGCASFVTTGCTASCGNGTVEPGEPCDGGGVATATCDADCTTPSCGDAACNAAAGETAASCAADCATSCGDGLVTGAEACDDGGSAAGDGCDAACAVEAGWSCDGAMPSVCTELTIDAGVEPDADTGAPDGGVGPGPDAGEDGAGGAGCCSAGADPRGGLLLALLVLGVALRTRRRPRLR